MKTIGLPTKFPATDPITRRRICQDCWNGLHQEPEHVMRRGQKELGRQCVEGCHCACREVEHTVLEERRVRKRARREREALMADMLKQSPLARPQSESQDVG